MFNGIYVSLYLFQLTVIGIILLKGNDLMGLAILPLPVITTVFLVYDQKNVFQVVLTTTNVSCAGSRATPGFS